MCFKKAKYLDPYYYLDLVLDRVFGKAEDFKTKAIYWIIYVLFSLLLAYIIYLVLSLILGTSLPLAIVVSGSMEPELHRGDVIILNSSKNLDVQTATIDTEIGEKYLRDFAQLNYKRNQYGLQEIDTITVSGQTFDVDDAITNDNSIVVYRSNTTPRDIIHRAVLKINANDGNYLLTKGDNSKTNRIIDQDCNINPESGKAQNVCLHVYPLNTENVIGKKLFKIPYLGYIKLFFFD